MHEHNTHAQHLVSSIMSDSTRQAKPAAVPQEHSAAPLPGSTSGLPPSFEFRGYRDLEVRWRSISDDELIGSGLVGGGAVPSLQYKKTRRGSAYKVVRRKDGKLNVELSATHVLTRGDPDLQRILTGMLHRASEEARGEAERSSPREEKLSHPVRLMMGATQGLDTDDLFAVIRLIDDWRVQIGKRAARSADVVSLSDWRALRR